MQENRDRSTLRPRFFAFIFPIQKGGHAQMERYEYPFSALVGQEKLKTALLLNLVEPRLGGVLIQGEKGTAKSTAVRGLAELMDEVEVAEGCPFHCRMDGEALCDECRSSPARRAVPYRRRVVELPVSATEDLVVGTLDLERALKEGVRAFEPVPGDPSGGLELHHPVRPALSAPARRRCGPVCGPGPGGRPRIRRQRARQISGGRAVWPEGGHGLRLIVRCGKGG